MSAIILPTVKAVWGEQTALGLFKCPISNIAGCYAYDMTKHGLYPE